MFEQRQRNLAAAFRSLAEHLKGSRDDPSTASKLIDEVNVKAELLGYLTKYVGWLTKRKTALWVVEPKTGYRVKVNYPQRKAEGLQALAEISAYRSLVQWAAMAERSEKLEAPYRRRKFFGVSALNTLVNEDVQIVRAAWSRMSEAGVKPFGSEIISASYEGNPGLEEIELLKSTFSIEGLSEFVGYEGESKMGLLGAVEKWVAGIEPRRDLGKNEKTDLPVVSAGFESMTRAEGPLQSAKLLEELPKTSKSRQSSKTEGTASSQFVTPKIICEEVSVSIDTVLGWIHAGTLRASNIGSSSSSRPRWRIARSDLADFLAVRSNCKIKDSKPAKRRRSKPTKKYV